MTKRTVSERALFRRINRRLLREDQILHKSRGFYDQGRGPYFDDSTGEYYIVSVSENAIAAKCVNLVELGRELGAIGEDEVVTRG